MTVDGAPPGGASLAHLAERCAAVAAEVAAGAGSLSRLGAAADELDAALGRDGGVGGAASPAVRATRDAAGDLVVALCGAGVDGVDRRALADALARLLRAFASDACAGGPPDEDPSPVPWQVSGRSAH